MESPVADHSTSGVSGRCLHCDAHLDEDRREADFCSPECAFVHRRIHQMGLGRFYQLRQKASSPARGTVFEKRDYEWLVQAVREEERMGRSLCEISLAISGVACAGCVWIVQTLLQKLPGVVEVRFRDHLGTLRLRWENGLLDPVILARELQLFGYVVAPLEEGTLSRTRNLPGTRLGLSGAFAMNTMLFTLPRYLGMEEDFLYARLFEWIALVFATLSLVIGGSYFMVRSWRALQRCILHMDTPIALGLILAYAGTLAGWVLGDVRYLYVDFVAIFTFLMLLGRWVQENAVASNRERLFRNRLRLESVVRVLSGDKLETVPPTRLQAGQTIRIRPGTPTPVKCRLKSKEGLFSLSWITGESEPVEARAGRLLPAGAMALGGQPVDVEALEEWRDSLLEKLLDAGVPDTERERWLSNVIRWYLVGVFAIAAAGLLAWGIWGGDWITGWQVTISILVVSCPCALGVAAPLVEDLAIERMRRLGVFIRVGNLWRRLRPVKKVILDKTGTLTLDALRLENPDALSDLDADARKILAGMVRDSLHPVAASLRESLLAEDPSLGSVTRDFSANAVEYPGKGLEWVHGDDVYRLGRPGWALEPDPRQQTSPAGTCYSRNGTAMAFFHFDEALRNRSREALAELQKQGRKILVLSGDTPAKVESMALRLGLTREQVKGGCSPEEKAVWVKSLDDKDTLMLGDGVNDSLAFQEAWCRGTPVLDRGLLEAKADFHFFGRSFHWLPRFWEVADSRHRALATVFAFSVIYNLAAIAVCLAGYMNPLVAAIIMPASSVVSVILARFAFGQAPG